MKFIGFAVFVIVFGIFEGANAYGKPFNWKKLNKTERVYGGYLERQDDPKKQGYTGLVEYYNNDVWEDACSASIITPNWIVATAWCLDNDGLTTDSLDFSITGLLGTLFETTLTETILYPTYDSNTLVDNIGVGRLADSVPDTGEFFGVLQGADYWYNDYFTGEKLYFCGYRDPYTAEEHIVEEPTCSYFIPRNRRTCDNSGLEMSEWEFCASSTDFTIVAACYYDFGAGLIVIGDDGEHYLYGLASYTSPNTCAEGPTAFLNMAFYNDFVNGNID